MTVSMVDEDDADYMHYGFWLKRTTDEDGVLTYNEVETFADSRRLTQAVPLMMSRAPQSITAAPRACT